MGKMVNVEYLFQEFRFVKSGKEIVQHAQKKLDFLKNKIEERQKRIITAREENGITDTDMITLLQQAMRNREARFYSLASNSLKDRNNGNLSEQERTIPAGVVQNILTEQENIEQEKIQCDRLGYVVRNVNESSEQRCSFTDLEFLGF